MLKEIALLSRRADVAIFIGLTTISVAGAATVHRFAITQTSGSGGATTFVQSSTAGSAFQAQVGGAAYQGLPYPFASFGFYNGGSTFGIGMLGISSSGYGVAGESKGKNPSILAYATGSGPALQAVTPSGSSADVIDAKSGGNAIAVNVQTADSVGVYTINNSTIDSAIYARNYNQTSVPQGLQLGGAVYADGNFGPGVFAVSQMDPPIVAEKDCTASTPGATEHSGANCSGIFLDDITAAGLDLVVYNAKNNTFPLYSDPQGNLTIAGTQYASDVAHTRSTNASTDMLTYAAQETERTVEDFGTAQLVGGLATVALGSDFRQTIDERARYMVFLTPAGDNKGLYVASRSAAGFVVREAQGGRSTMSFDYRIVAKPYGAHQPRMPREAALHEMPVARPDDGVLRSQTEQLRHHVQPEIPKAFADFLFQR